MAGQHSGNVRARTAGSPGPAGRTVTRRNGARLTSLTQKPIRSDYSLRRSALHVDNSTAGDDLMLTYSARGIVRGPRGLGRRRVERAGPCERPSGPETATAPLDARCEPETAREGRRGRPAADSQIREWHIADQRLAAMANFCRTRLRGLILFRGNERERRRWRAATLNAARKVRLAAPASSVEDFI